MSKATEPRIEGSSRAPYGGSAEAARDPSEAERRGAHLAAAAVLALFGVVMLGWVVLGHASAHAGAEAPNGVERR
jgi:hypothetical protein